MVIVIYHDNCRDGQGALYAAKTYYQQHPDVPVEYVAWNYGMGLPAILNREDGCDDIVDILDFCFSPKEMEYLCDKFLQVNLIDHHATAIKDMASMSRNNLICSLDRNHSGAVLAWKHYFPYIPVPLVLQYIEDHDLWNYQLPYSRVIRAWMGLFSVKGHQHIQDMDHALTHHMAATFLIGEAIFKTTEQRVQHIASKAKIAVLENNQRYAIQNCNTDISEVGEYMVKELNVDFAVTYFDDIFAGVKRVSLRSLKGGNVDVSRIAKNLGGGGHFSASGFTVPITYTHFAIHTALNDTTYLIDRETK